MTYYHNQGKNSPRFITLNDLKAQLFSLNRQTLLAMEYHDEETQAAIQKRIAEVQKKIDHMLAAISD